MTEETDSLEIAESKAKKPLYQKLFRVAFYVFIVVLISLFLGTWYLSSLNQPPTDFPLEKPIVIEKGSSVKQISYTLAENSVVKSADLLYYTLVLFHDPSNLKASTYIFDEKLTTRQIARRLSEGDFDTDLIRFTHIEGERATHIATRAQKVLPNFDPVDFIEKAEPFEGRLYPDTYFVPATYNSDDLLELLLSTFEEKSAPLQSSIKNSGLSLEEILVLASILEREANSPESMRMVSGILQNRLEIGMALQADASIEYILDKPLSELTPNDLKIDSPYNTNLYPGLPPTPIGNPGLEAIEAVLNPDETENFYYITGNDGEFYYAETYNQHLNNIEKYLK